MKIRFKKGTLLVSISTILIIFLIFFINSWELKNKKELVKVAILDSGIYENHAFFSDMTFKTYNASEKHNNHGNDDFNHGTGVASLIVNSLTEEERKRLVIYNVKILNEKGAGDSSSMIKGLKWAIDEGVNVINISAGFQTNNARIEQLINQAYEKGIVIIASAGNNLGFDVDYPARLENVISVSSISESKTQSLTSSIGKIDFASIGEDVKVANNENTYSIRSGSSFATAKITSFLINNMLVNDSLRGYESCYKFLLNNAQKLSSNEKDIFGNGYIE